MNNTGNRQRYIVCGYKPGPLWDQRCNEVSMPTSSSWVYPPGWGPFFFSGKDMSVPVDVCVEAFRAGPTLGIYPECALQVKKSTFLSQLLFIKRSSLACFFQRQTKRSLFLNIPMANFYSAFWAKPSI